MSLSHLGIRDPLATGQAWCNKGSRSNPPQHGIDRFLPQIRILHIGLVVVGGSLFLARGVAVLRGASWPMAVAVRRTSYGIDTALLTAALTLMHILQLNPLQVGWDRPLALLLLYIVLGMAPNGPRPRWRRLAICGRAVVPGLHGLSCACA